MISFPQTQIQKQPPAMKTTTLAALIALTLPAFAADEPAASDAGTLDKAAADKAHG